MSDKEKKYRSCPAVRVEKPETWGLLKEGEFFWWEREDVQGKRELGIICRIPTNREVSIIDYLRVESEEKPLWNWDGDKENPTLKPSISIRGEDFSVEVWHGYLKAGNWEACE